MLKKGEAGMQGFPNLLDQRTLLLQICWGQCSMEHTLRKLTPHSLIWLSSGYLNLSPCPILESEIPGARHTSRGRVLTTSLDNLFHPRPLC